LVNLFELYDEARTCQRQMPNLVLCGIALVWFPDDVTLWGETCMNIQCDNIIIQISK